MKKYEVLEMNVFSKVNNKLAAFSDYIRASKKRAVLWGGLLYTVMFFAFVIVYMSYDIAATGSYLGGDGVAAYYPDLLDFRRNVISFFEGLKNGTPELTFINFDRLYGTDNFLSIYLPLFPFFALSALFSEAAMPMFLTVGLLILSYFVGISFLYLCSYFKRDMIWSGFFAAFYVFCGNYFYTGAFNHQFLYMYIAFPLMIIGIDRIINENGGWILLSLSVGWVAILGLPNIIYTVPFVVVYAIVRVYFVHKKTFFKSLGKYFLRGALSVILGFGLSAFTLLTYVMSFLGSVRAGGEKDIDFLKLLIPSFEYTYDFFRGEGTDISTTIAIGAIICFIYLFTSLRTKKEIKCMSFVMLMLIAFPVIRYGLNGFSYDICRWGFVPALFVSFVCVDYLPRFIRIKGTERKMFLFIIITYTVLSTIGAKKWAIAFIFVMALVNAVPALRKYVLKLGEALKRFVISANPADTTKKGIIPVLIVSLSIIAIILAIVYIIATNSLTPTPILIITVLLTILSLAISSRKNLKAVGCVFLAGVYVVTALNYTRVGGISLVSKSPVIEELLKIEETENTFGRASWFISDTDIVAPVKDEDETVEETESSSSKETKSESESEAPSISKYGFEYVQDEQINLSTRYEIASAESFQGIVNGDLMKFMLRCGQTPISLYSTVYVLGFGGRESLYSLFGFENLVSNAKSDRFYGIEVDKEFDFEKEQKAYFYKNKYALPAGVTYDGFMSEERFNALNGAELPYAMMNDVYLEGYDVNEYVNDEYSKECSFTLKQDLRGETDLGMTCYDNYITVNDETKGKFIYLLFEGVEARTFMGIHEEPVTIKVDNKTEYYYGVHNSNSIWEWRITNDMYVFPLGFQKENLKDIEFISPFEFESVKIIAVPEEIYVDAYYERTEEILEDLEVSTNTLTGNISLSKDKVLVISLLHNNGWTAYVDGEKVPTYKTNGLFIGIPLTAGEHSIRLDYITPYFIEGLIISGASLIILLAVYFVTKRKKKAVKAENDA